ncbi:hypothetical protein BZG36_00407 [Bifiguratus adelaidae]|uniref:type I protein arginine methyltransferase n=1 Tax=Bifiguratus adelaidae TaxID=1938954 RepID=A0A261Y8I8_9FUNG|nr:hypothetical protein BZG36_00407 [Bifiguratus adelaidae]
MSSTTSSTHQSEREQRDVVGHRGPEGPASSTVRFNFLRKTDLLDTMESDRGYDTDRWSVAATVDDADSVVSGHGKDTSSMSGDVHDHTYHFSVSTPDIATFGPATTFTSSDLGAGGLKDHRKDSIASMQGGVESTRKEREDRMRVEESEDYDSAQGSRSAVADCGDEEDRSRLGGSLMADDGDDRSTAEDFVDEANQINDDISAPSQPQPSFVMTKTYDELVEENELLKAQLRQMESFGKFVESDGPEDMKMASVADRDTPTESTPHPLIPKLNQLSNQLDSVVTALPSMHSSHALLLWRLLANRYFTILPFGPDYLILNKAYTEQIERFERTVGHETAAWYRKQTVQSLKNSPEDTRAWFSTVRAQTREEMNNLFAENPTAMERFNELLNVAEALSFELHEYNEDVRIRWEGVDESGSVAANGANTVEIHFITSPGNLILYVATTCTFLLHGIIADMEDLTSRDYYFDSYAHFGIHEEMLKDDVRTTSYRTAIYQNRHLFQDKIVLDVGCGTGILSMFAVKAGAKHVYGVDMSNIIHQAKQIVQDNNMSDKITLIQAKMEEVQLPVQEVDIIVSEWMGYFLLYESMLDTVIVARDRYLKKEGGLIFPDCATMYLAAIEDEDYKAEKFGYWDNVYGFNYSSLKNVVMKEPLVDYVEAKAVVTSPFALKTLDLYTVTKADLAFEVPFKMKAARDDFVHAFVSWFDICFLRCPRTVRFSTGPHAKRTHWKQTVFYIDETLAIKGGEWIDGVLRSKPSENNPRHLEIEIDYDFQGALHQTQERREYKL